MKELQEVNVTAVRYLKLRFLVTCKEYYLRWQNHRLRWLLILLFIIILTYVNIGVGLGLLGLIFLIVIVDFIYDLYLAFKGFSVAVEKYPMGTLLDFDFEGFQRYSYDNLFWKKVEWHFISFGIFFQREKALVLYHKGDREYYFFFEVGENQENFHQFKKIAFSKVKRIY